MAAFKMIESVLTPLLSADHAELIWENSHFNHDWICDYYISVVLIFAIFVILGLADVHTQNWLTNKTRIIAVVNHLLISLNYN